MGRVLDLIFPLECLACGAPGTHACVACLAAVPLAPKIFRSGAVRAAAGFAYAQPFVRHLLHDAKFEGWTCALAPLEALVRRTVAKLDGVFPPDAIVMPVPLHPSRLRARGFNQAEILARAAAQATGRPCAVGVLQRDRRTRPQTDAGDRAGNVRGAFVVRTVPLRGRPVILVDDVITSGATMRECATALQRAGAGGIYGLALAWGSGEKEDEAGASSSIFT